MPARSAPGDVSLRTLPNGLRLIVREQRGAGLVAIDIWVRAGSGREEREESGAAHFLEHLLFKGTPSRKPGEIDAAIEDLGATLNAGTLRDGAHVFTTVAAAYLETALEVMGDALQNAMLAPEEVERERTVILDEMARSRNDLRKQAIHRLYALLYPDHPYGRPILGLVESLRTIPRERIVGFYRRLYAPANTTIVLAGDIAPEVAEIAVRKVFGNWAPRSVPAPPSLSIPEAKDLAPVTEPTLGKTAAVAVGFRLAGAGMGEEIGIAEVVSALLGDERAGRLPRALEAAGVAANVSVELEPLRASSFFRVYAAVSPAHVAAARRVIMEELQRLQKEAVSTEEMEYVKRRVLGAHLFDTEIVGGSARLVGLYEVVGDYRFALRFSDSIRKVKPEDIRAFAQRYFERSRCAEVILLPEGAR